MTSSSVVIAPDDTYNQQLTENVHPSGWQNPTPDARYNLVIIGAGTAGLVMAATAAGLGARVALIERHLMGGDCLNFGCVPSKGIIRASRAWAAASNAVEFGLTLPPETEGDFPTAMARMRRLRAEISRLDSAERFKELGVAVYIGNARFTARDAVKVGETVLQFSRAAICTGARAAVPTIPGLKEAGYLTNETVFSLTTLPRQLVVIGAGPIGCELAQAFARFGSDVTLIEQTSCILPREDTDAAMMVQTRMANDGVSFAFKAIVHNITSDSGLKRVHYSVAGEKRELLVDEILVSVGRVPNVEGLGLDTAGVAYKKAGITVDPNLRTTNKQIYAAGDICFPFKFTHTADAMAQIVIQNALFPHPFGLGLASTESLIIPWCTFTEPEIAHVGMYKNDAQAKGFDVETFTQTLDEVDRAVLDGEDDGFAKVHVKRGTDKILGATIVAADAGNLISEVTVAMNAGAGLGTIASTIHPYPTQAEVLRKAAYQMRKARFSALQKSILRTLFAWRR